jgi:hypothetical protein
LGFNKKGGVRTPPFLFVPGQVFTSGDRFGGIRSDLHRLNLVTYYLFEAISANILATTDSSVGFRALIRTST